MNSEEIKAINALCESVKETVTLGFLSVGDEISDSIENTLVLIVESASCIVLEKKKDTDQHEPFIRIRDNIRLKARPAQKIFHLFVDIIDASLNPDRYIKGFDAQDITAPVYLKVYISPFCPYCPTVVKEMVKLALSSKQIQLEIIDGTLFTGKAMQDGIMAAPTVICDCKHRWSGIVSAREILDVICRRKPEDLSQETLKAMVEAGNAMDLAQMMIKENKVFPAFYGLLTHDKWPVRLGAMVTVETIHESSPPLIENIMETLWGRYPEVSDTVKGDIIYLAGEVANESYKKKLDALLHENLSDDLHESVMESIKSLQKRHSFGS